MTDDRQATCEERIEAQLASREDDVRKMLAVQDGVTRFCRHCGNEITERVREINGAETWGQTSWGDDRDFQCGIAVDGHHEPDEDYTEDSLSEFGLGLSRKITLRFDMSTGGPADWLEVLCDENFSVAGNGVPLDLTVERVTYHFSDWFDHAEQTVEEGSPLFELAEWLAETESS